MSRALLLLIGLQLRGWLRFLGRNARTLRGALTALLGGGVFALWLLTFLLPSRESARIDPESLRRNGPAFLLFYCLVNVFASTGERAIYFSPGEVNFLFAGPFGRREILGYKVVSTFLLSLPSTLVFAVFVGTNANWFWAAYVALLLVILFQQLFGMALNLIAAAAGATAYGRGRRVALVALLALAVVAALGVAGPAGKWDLRSAPGAVIGSTAGQAVLTPLRWFFDAFLAERLWPDLVVNAGRAALVNLALLGVVFALDANYLEAAATSSARIYAQIQRLRRGGMAAAGRGGKARFGVPNLPYWGGVGPVLWRQLTTAVRGLGRLALALVIVGAFLVVPLLERGAAEDSPGAGAALAFLIVWLTVFLTQLVPFDFRGDVDRIAALKSLPVVSWRLSVGQILAPVLIVTAVQWAALAVLRVLALLEGGALLASAAFAAPFNFLLFALENFLFLRFPARVMAAAPGDFQAVGRNLLFVLAKMAVLTAVAVVALAFGGLGWLLTRVLFTLAGPGFDPEAAQSLAYAAGAASAWLVVAFSGLGLVPLVAWAFNAFDVGLDTPP